MNQCSQTQLKPRERSSFESSGRSSTMAPIGLIMKPTSPLPSLKFHSWDFSSKVSRLACEIEPFEAKRRLADLQPGKKDRLSKIPKAFVGCAPALRNDPFASAMACTPNGITAIILGVKISWLATFSGLVKLSSNRCGKSLPT